MDRVINLRLLSHPVNWLVVWSVLLFAGFAYVHIHDALFVTTSATDEAN